MTAPGVGLAPQWQDALEVAGQPGFGRWRQQVAATGGCAAPIHLTGGFRLILASTGEILHSYTTDDEPGERVLVACGNRRTSRCPPCAETYRADSYQLIKAGLTGGKGVPETVRDHPRVFATFTAPGFGPVHHRVVGADGKIRRCHSHGQPACRRRHRKDDPVLGQPLAPQTYDYAGAVIWNALAPALWARTMTLLRRELARIAGIRQRDFAERCRLSFGKVAEYQTRAVVHFHAVIRIDGIAPDDPDRAFPPDEWAIVDIVADAIRAVVARAVISSPDCEAAGGTREIRWGEQLDIRAIEAFDADQELSDDAVAGYIAKYATKGAECTGTIDAPVCCRLCKGTGVADPGIECNHCAGTGSTQTLSQLDITEHAKRMLLTCWALGDESALAELRLRPWAHMLGFRGHFSTKSRRYSTTLTALRNVRRDWRTTRTVAAVGLEPDTPVVRRSEHEPPDDLVDDERSVLVLGHWRYAGRGHSVGQALFAKTIAEDLAESRRIARQVAREEEPWEGTA